MSTYSILFICGSIESGLDGVGDYTRRLAGEMIRQGHRASILSINDKYVNITSEEVQDDNGTEVQTLRLPSNKNYSQKIQCAKEFVELIKPDWLSLQYVPFSFQSKGLHFGLAKMLYKIGKGRKWHIMFHELWVGMAKEDPKKYILLGYLQKKLIYSINNKVKPTLITTSIDIYSYYLSEMRIDNIILPLFSNIRKHLLFSDSIDTLFFSGNVIFTIFGTIHSGAPIKELASDIYQHFQNKALLVIIGKTNSESSTWKRVFEKNNITVLILGEMNEQNISEVLAKSNFGIVTTPYLLVTKSGSAAAMRLHGLPIICVSREWTARRPYNYKGIDGVYNYKPNNLSSFLNMPVKCDFKNDVNIISSRFTNYLKSN